jgi:hypothetical protein
MRVLVFYFSIETFLCVLVMRGSEAAVCVFVSPLCLIVGLIIYWAAARSGGN